MLGATALACLVSTAAEHSIRAADKPDAFGSGLAAVAVMVLLFAIYGWWRTRRYQRIAKRLGVRDLVLSAAVGNALVDLDAMLQPSRPDAAVIARIEEDQPVDDVGDGRT